MTRPLGADSPREPGAVSTAVARRNVAALSLAQMLGSTGLGLCFTVSTITASELSGSDVVAALAQTSVIVGAALFTLPVARLAERRGRRISLWLTSLVAALGFALAALGVALGAWPVMFVGLAIAGSGTVVGLAARFAAADSARTRAEIPTFIAFVLWASTVGSILGPNLIGPLGAVDGLDSRVLAFALAAVMFALASLIVRLFLRDVPRAPETGPVPTIDDRGPDAGGSSGAPGTSARSMPFAEQLRLLRAHPGAARGIALAALGHAVMVGLMGLAPVQLHHGGVDDALIGVAMSAHLGGMYALSPVFGWLTARFGAWRMGVVGVIALLAAALILAVSPAHGAGQFTVGLFALGIGWSITLVAASTLVTASSPPRARIPLQGLSDLAMSLAGAAASVTGGVVVGLVGYSTLAWGAMGVIAVLAVGLAAPGIGARRAD